MSPQRLNLPAICHAVEQTFNKKLFQKTKNSVSRIISGMVRQLGEKIEYCSVGHLACHSYFALCIETLEK